MLTTRFFYEDKHDTKIVTLNLAISSITDKSIPLNKTKVVLPTHHFYNICFNMKENIYFLQQWSLRRD